MKEITEEKYSFTVMIYRDMRWILVIKVIIMVHQVSPMVFGHVVCCGVSHWLMLIEVDHVIWWMMYEVITI